MHYTIRDIHKYAILLSFNRKLNLKSFLLPYLKIRANLPNADLFVYKLVRLALKCLQIRY